MIVGNFYAAALGRVVNATYTLKPALGSEFSSDGSGYIESLLNYGATSAKTPSSASTSGPYLALGTDDTPATGEDYTLGGITDKYDVVSTFCEKQYNFKKSFFTITRIVQNNQSDNITIKEVGLFSRTSSGGSVLWARQVLDTPVVIKPGEKRAFVMTLSA